MGESLTDRSGHDRDRPGRTTTSTTGGRSIPAAVRATRERSDVGGDTAWHTVEPVTATMLARDTATVLDRVEHQGLDVPVVRHGVMVAVIRPTTPLQAATATSTEKGRQVSSRDLQRGAAGAMLRDVATGAAVVLTRQNKPIAMVVDAATVADDIDGRLAPVLKEAHDVFARMDAEPDQSQPG